MSKLAKGYTCPQCNTENEFPVYVYGHWHEELTHTCDCGAKNDILAGKLISSVPASKPKAAKGRQTKPAQSRA